MPRTLNEGAAMKTLLTSLSVLFLLSTAASAAGQSTPLPTPRPVGTAGASVTSGATSGPAETTVTKPAANMLSADYRLVPGDKLRVEVYKDAQLSQSVQVRPDGKITLPLANDVVAAGRTPGELREAIATSLKPFITSPTVTVIVVETIPPVVYVMGEVTHPGAQPLNGKLDVLQALSMAGGFRDFANTKNIKVRRGSDLLPFNYKDAVNGRGTPLLLKPGDTIIVP